MAYQYIYGSDTMEAATRKINENFLDIPTSESITAEAVAEAKEYTDSVVSNPNMLINGDFQVWQRGTSFTSTASALVYTADRWVVGGVNDGKTHTITQDTDGSIKVNPNGGYTNLRQVIENVQSLRGREVTLSVMAKGNRTDGNRTALQLFLMNGTISSTTFFAQDQNITVSNDEYELFQITGTVPDDAENITVRLYIYTFNVINIKYVKLEVGNIATPLSPRSYAEELADCYRYFYKLNTTNTGIPSLGAAVMRTATLCLPTLWLPTAMRAVPTIDYSGFQALIDSSLVPIDSIAIQACAGQNISLRITLSENSTIGKAVFIQGTNSGENNLTLDADIFS